MSVAESSSVNLSSPLGMPASSERRPWHRIPEVRRQQGVSHRSISRRLGLTAEEIRRQEDPTADLRLSELAAWQRALGVPLTDLLMDLDAPLSGPVLTRARMLRIMKTVQAMRDTATEPAIERMTQMLYEQLVEAMPELAEVAPWHTVGQRRTQHEMGHIADNPISANFIQESLQ